MSSAPFFSIVMPSYLGEYGGNYGKCATDRVEKFKRAVRSVIDQDQHTTSWELIVVSDGCEQTTYLRDFWPDPRIKFFEIPKQRLWSATVRNTGIRMASGEYIVYLDTDDKLGPTHLHDLRSALFTAGFPKWCVFDDWVWNTIKKVWEQRVADSTRNRGAGTSQIAHRRNSGILWPDVEFRHPAMGYDHDEQFLRHLRHHHGGQWIGVGQYFVMHYPRHYDL